METIEEFNTRILRDNTLNLKIEYANEHKHFVNVLLNNELVAQFDIYKDIPELRLFNNNKMFYLFKKRDIDFDRKWKEKINYLTLKQKNKCRYCKLIFEGNIPKSLHHKKSEQKLKELERLKQKIIKKILDKKITLENGIKDYNSHIKQYIDYYKSLKDTDLICNNCHLEIHKSIVS